MAAKTNSDIEFLMAVNKSRNVTSESSQKEERTREAIDAIVSINNAIGRLEQLESKGHTSSFATNTLLNMRHQTGLLEKEFLQEVRKVEPLGSTTPKRHQESNQDSRSRIQSCRGCAKLQRSTYTKSDDMKIIQFICKNKLHKEANSPKNRMWDQLQKEVKFNRPHKPSGVAWHYREILRPKLSQYVSPIELKNFPRITAPNPGHHTQKEFCC